MKKVIILAVLSLMGQTAWAQIRDFQTTRLLSTGGTGVASILATEAAILNPASPAFFEGSSFSHQSYDAVLRGESAERRSNNDRFPSNNTSTGTFLADHSGPIKGGVAYIQQNENRHQRQRMVLHGATAMSKSSSMGMSYNYIQDTLPAGSRNRHRVHHQLILGTSHIIDEDTVLGLVIKDPTLTNSGDERALAGFQYSVASRFILMGDLGVQFTKDVSKNYLWSAAIQMNIFNDFFLRLGQFYDNITKFKGTGWGASWIGPRFGIEFAQRYSDQIGGGNYIYPDESFIDTSLSVIIKF